MVLRSPNIWRRKSGARPLVHPHNADGPSAGMPGLAVANEATETLIDAEAFAKMRRDAVFINVSRGNLVDETALAAALAGENRQRRA